MGEIGIDYDLALKRLTWKEIRAVIRGYRRREHGAWERMRFHLWALRCTLGGKENDPKELIAFPWEKESDDTPTLEEIERVRKQLQEVNRKNQEAIEGKTINQ